MNTYIHTEKCSTLKLKANWCQLYEITKWNCRLNEMDHINIQTRRSLPKVFSDSFLWTVLGESLWIEEIFRGNKQKFGSIFFYGYGFVIVDLFRRCRSQMFFQTAVLINLAELTGKHLCRSLFFSLSVKVAFRVCYCFLLLLLFHRIPWVAASVFLPMI